MERYPVCVCGKFKKEESYTRTLVNDKHKESTQIGLLNLYKEKLFCDVTLISNEDKTKIHAHKNVLCAHSEYFSTMFRSGLKESIENEVVLYNISGKNLLNIVNYCYTGKIDCNIDTVESLIVNASLMLLEGVIELCSEFLIKELSPINCLGFRFFAKQYQIKSLHEKAKEFTQVYFQEVIKQEEFFSQTLDQLEEYLTDNELNVFSEKEVFKAIINWIRVKEEERLPAVTKILHVLRSPMIDEEFIDYFFDMGTEFDKKCSALVKKTFETLKPNTKLRLNRTEKIILINEKHAYVFDPINQSTNLLYTFDEGLIDIQLTILINEKLVTYNDYEMLYIDLRTGKVHTLPYKNNCLMFNKMMACHGTIYAFQGVNSFFRYDFDLKLWSHLESTERRRLNASCCVLNDRLYVIGGKYDLGVYSNAVECYDPIYNKWITCKSMFRKRANSCAVAVNNFIFVFGGRFGPCSLHEDLSVERYDPQTDTWILFDAPFANQYLPPDTRTCVYNNKIYFLCSSIDKQILVRIFDPQTLYWGMSYKFNLDCKNFLAYSVPNVVLP